MSKWTYLLGSGLVAAAVGGWWFYKKPLHKGLSYEQESKLLVQNESEAKGKDSYKNINKDSGYDASAARDAQSTGASKAAVVLRQGTSEAGNRVSAELRGWTESAEVLAYSQIHSKVLVSEQEKDQRKALLQDRVLIRRTTELLTNPQVVTQMSDREISTGIDLLVESFRMDNHGVARESILGLIQDSKLEDGGLDTEARQALAEVKAEILFAALGADPFIDEELSVSEFGPVTGRIYENVQAERALILEESRVSSRVSSTN